MVALADSMLACWGIDKPTERHWPFPLAVAELLVRANAYLTPKE